MSGNGTRRRIIGAGLPRTGTTSLCSALETLGYGPVLHAHEEDEPPLYRHLLKAKLRHPDKDIFELQMVTGVSLERLTSKYNATTDSPTMDFYYELLQLYPNSLVILTVRDTDDQWWSSWYDTLGDFYSSSWMARLWRALLWIQPGNAGPRRQMILAYTQLWRSKYGVYGPNIHRLHNLEVKNRVPSDRLLVYNVKEGWQPLCQFLGVEVPASSFPYVNKKHDFTKRFRPYQHLVIVKCILRWLVVVSIPIIGYAIHTLLYH